MKLEKALRREQKHQKKNKHVTDSRSVFQIKEELIKRKEKIRKLREQKELEKSSY